MAAAGATDTTGSAAAAGAPNQPLTIQQVSVADVPSSASTHPHRHAVGHPDVLITPSLNEGAQQ